MTGAFKSFLALPEQDRRDVFEAAAARLDTLQNHVEKDFWVCLILETLFNRLPEGHPRLLFKGGTSLSKAFGLIKRIFDVWGISTHDHALSQSSHGGPPPL